jgi:DNA processing protein
MNINPLTGAQALVVRGIENSLGNKQNGNSVSDQLALLALSSIRGVGYWTLWHMARAGVRFSDFILQNDSNEQASTALKKFGARLDNNLTSHWPVVRERALEQATKRLRELAECGVRLIMADEPDYPSSLRDLLDPPAWLFVRGNAAVLNAPSVSVVGTRQPSSDGLWLAQFVGANLLNWGVPTVSGLAPGIDQLIHEWSLRMNVPTVAVLGTGISSDYPKGSEALRERIVQAGGVIVTEYLLRDTYSAENFVRRNRLQAALGRVLIPVEWSPHSGTAHTVRYACTLKRPIAGLRLPDWPQNRVILGDVTEGEIFTIPPEEAQFREFVARSINRKQYSREQGQFNFFDRLE